MISVERQEEILEQFRNMEVRVNPDGSVDKRLVASHRWKEIKPVKSGASWYLRYTISGRKYDVPAGAVLLLWRLRRTVSEALSVGYEDNNPDNLHPDNICLWNRADYFAWCERRRAAVQGRDNA